ncbi:glycoside hydrolase family 76 protein, partial [Arcticibacter sp.]|uniref:glycoside hydrolase family 76 protein n=1 Tax=Arcticibacter sp. TaxID=1872630 RepID=UPI00388ED6FA
GWSDVKNGGIAWATGSPNSKNACSNAPAAIIAARMYKLNGNPDDLEWSKKIYAWLKNYVVEPERGLVWDAHGNTKESDIYTYNQGTFIGAAMELYLITNQYTYMVDALRTSTYVVEDQVRFSPGGILKGENTGDGGLFKGVFIRYLTEYIVRGGVNEATKQKFLKYLKSNAVSLHSKATLNPGNIFGNDWKTLPASKVCDASVHISGTMLFESVDKLQRLKLLD